MYTAVRTGPVVPFDSGYRRWAGAHAYQVAKIKLAKHLRLRSIAPTGGPATVCLWRGMSFPGVETAMYRTQIQCARSVS